VKEITSKFASADFQNCCWLASKKCAERAGLFQLRGNTACGQKELTPCQISVYRKKNCWTI